VDVRSVVVRLGLNTSDYARGAGSAVAANQRIAGSLDRVATKGLTTEKAMDRIGHVSGKAFLGGAAAIGYAEKKAADFNEVMATVATLSHANTREYNQLAEAAKSVGVNIGYSATSSAKAEEELIKAGVSLKDIMGGGLKGALDLAAAGQTDVATATEVAASAMTQFKLEGKDVPHIADLLAAGADKALGSVTDLGYGLSQVGTTAHQMGFSIEETTGTLAEFAQSGLLGEKGGSTLKQMFLQLASPTKKAQGLMDQYGLSLYKANGQMKSMPELADNLQRSFKGLTPAQRNYALGVIFGARAIQGANILIRDGEKTNRRWINSVDDQGFAAQQASGKMNSLKGDVAKLKAQFDNAFINASGKQNFLRDLVQDGTKLIRVYNNLSDAQRQAFDQKLVHGVEFAGAIYGATKVYKLVKATGELLDFAAGTKGASKILGSAVLGKATKGVTPVFVTNPGFGKGGPGVTAPGSSRVRRQAERNATRTTASRGEQDAAAATAGSVRLAAAATAAAVAGGIFAGRKFNAWATGSGDHNLAKDAKMASSYQGRNVVGKGLAKANDLLNNTDYGKAVENIKKLDAQLAKEAKQDPAQAIVDYQKALDKTGMSAAQLNKVLPKTAEVMNPTTNPFKGVAATAGEAGKVVSRYAKTWKSIPKDLRTYVSTPGAVPSLGVMRNLQKVYHLTPKQVRTIMQLQGFSEAQIRIFQAGRAFRSLPKAVKTALRADTVKSMADVRRLVRQYNLTPAQKNTLMKVSGVDAAIAKVRALRIEIAGVRSKSVTITEIRRGDKAKSPGPVKHPDGTTSASGSTVPKTGRGYADRHHYLLADGEEVTSNRRGQADRYRPVLKAINADLPRDQIKAMLAGGGTVGYRLAAGGTASYATGPGVTVTFPAPAVYDQAVKAADAIAAAGAKYAATAAETRGTRLDDLHLQQQIAQTQKSLTEHEDKKVKVKNKHGKGTHEKTLKGKGGYSLTGIDRAVAAAELNDQKAQLAEIRKQSAVAKALADARAEAVEALKQARTDEQNTLAGATDYFARGASGTAVLGSINKDLRDVTQYGQNIAALKGKGASAALLNLVKSKADSGDFTAANKLAKSILESPALLGQFNAALGARDSAEAAIANITTDPRFLGTGAWNPTSLAPQVVQFQVMDPTPMISEVVRQTVHIIRGELVNG
jgi:TP901 family phage tail tape measure protein